MFCTKALINVLWLCCLAGIALAQTTIPASVVANGGNRAASAAYTLQSTVGQATIGFTAGPLNQHGIGFWYREGGILTGIADQFPPAQPDLGAASPNPFNPRTTIDYVTVVPGRVSLRLYDLGGRLVRVLVDEELAAGAHETMLDGTGLASGIYVCRMTAGAFTQTRKLALVK